MKVAAIFINYRTAEMTLTALEALLNELSAVGSHHVFIVDNDSRDGSYETMCRGVEERALGDRVTVIAAPRNGGYGYGINVGVTAGLKGQRPDYFYVINTDATPDPSSVKKLIDFMDDHPNVGLAGSRIHDEEETTEAAAFRFPTVYSELEEAAAWGPISKLLKRHIISIPAPKQHTRVDWIPGTSMMIRTSVFERGVWFDEEFFLYFEEIDFAQQVTQAGWEIYCVADAPISHLGSVSTGINDSSKPLPDYWFDSRWRYFTKYHGYRYALLCDAARAVGQTINVTKSALLRRPQHTRPRVVSGMVRGALRWKLRGKRSAGELAWLELLAEDLMTYGLRATAPGFWAVSVHRLGRHMTNSASPIRRAALRAPHKVLATTVDWLWRIRISDEVELGRRILLSEDGGILVVAEAIGDDVEIQHDTTVGPLRGTGEDARGLPTIQDRVRLYSGSSVLGRVTVEHDAVVMHNSVVLGNVAAGTIMRGVPAKAVETKTDDGPPRDGPEVHQRERKPVAAA